MMELVPDIDRRHRLGYEIIETNQSVPDLTSHLLFNRTYGVKASEDDPFTRRKMLWQRQLNS